MDTGLHLYDLRHTGSTWSAQSGATLKELMARIGHSSIRAAMIYQHASRDRDDAIAAALKRADRGGSQQGRRMIWHGSGTTRGPGPQVRAVSQGWS
ncbi:tyrosine-type recombinase/integrase [Couchioplanes caeruleus]|uniref:tyrosine-type recombinase/integrase n=1 Tax=Couchioplanes caeruleus TaxID=56438 RepID=UPI00373FCCA0